MSFFRPFIWTPELKATVLNLTAQQEELRKQIKLQPVPHPIRRLAGCDSSFIGDQILSIFVLFSYPDLQELEVVSHLSQATLPYIPGFLAFRELPNLLLAYQKLHHHPDLIMVDGQGIQHPRRMGIATHLGLTLSIPTIGVAKKKLVGTYQEPAESKGSATPLWHGTDHLGFVVRSKDRVKPLFVSPGHLCDHQTALDITLATLRAHKLPEPTRLADKYSKEYKTTLKKLS